MSILIIAFAGALNSASDRIAVRNVQKNETTQAMGHVIEGHPASARYWKPDSHANQREVIKIEKDGRAVLLRLTEFE